MKLDLTRARGSSESGPTLLEKKVQELDDAKGDQEQYFAKLLEINLRYIEKYYSLAGEQAGKSYKLTLWTASAGFVVLLAGITMSFFPDLRVEPKAATVGSGLMIEFIGAVFFVLYNRTVRQLNSNHEKLVQLQDVVLALRTAQSINRDHLDLYNETMRYLAEMLIVGRRTDGGANLSLARAGAETSQNGAIARAKDT